MKKAYVAAITLFFVILASIIWIKQTPSPLPPDQSQLKVGFIAPFDPALGLEDVSQNILAAAMIAAEEINQNGGIFGHPIKIIWSDGRCSQENARDAAKKLIESGAVAIIGGACSAETLGAAPIANNKKVPLISPASTSPLISHAGPYVYRLIPSDHFQGVYAARIAKDKFGRKAAILACPEDYCQGLRNSFAEAFENNGGIIVSDITFPKNTTDFLPLLKKIVAASPDVLYFPAYPPDAINAVKQFTNAGWQKNIAVIGPDAWDNDRMWRTLGRTAEGFLFTKPTNKSLPPSFVEKMKKETRTNSIVVFAPRAYDAVKILAHAIQQNNSANGRAIKNALDHIARFEGIADTYTFDANGDITNASYDLNVIKNGKIQSL